MKNTHRIPLAKLWMFILAVVSAAWVAGPVPVSAEEDKGKRGLRRLVPRPFKKEKVEPKTSDSDRAAVEDMREFTEKLTGQKPRVETAGSEASVPKIVKPAPAQVVKPAPDQVAKPAPAQDVTASGLPKVKLLPEKKSPRRRLLRVPFVGGDEESDEPSEPEDRSRRSRLLRVPFVGGKEDPPPPAIVPPAVSEHAVEAVPDTGATIQPIAETAAPPAEKSKRSRWLKIPFVGGRDEEPQDSEPENAVATPVKPKPLATPRRKEIAAEAPAPEENDDENDDEKRGLFGRIKSIGSKDDEPKHATAPPSRDIGTGDKYIVSVDGTPFYSIGPSQPLPPDEILSSGNVVTMRTAGWGWSDIELPGGRIGVVASKNLRKATPADVGGSYASRRGSRDQRGIWRVFNYDPTPEPELPSDSGGIPLGAGLLPPLDDE